MLKHKSIEGNIDYNIEDLKREIYFLLARRFGGKSEDIFLEAVWAGTEQAVSDFTGLTGMDLKILLNLREAFLYQQGFHLRLRNVYEMLLDEGKQVYNAIAGEGKANA